MKNIKKHYFLELSLLCLCIAIITAALNIPNILAGNNATLLYGTTRVTNSVSTDEAEKMTATDDSVETTTASTANVSTSTTKTTATASNSVPVSESIKTMAKHTTATAAVSTNSKSNSSSGSNSKSDTNRERAAELTPSFTFSSPKSGETLANKVKIESAVSGASNVEFYLIASDSNTKKYIGTAKAQPNNVWNLDFDSTNSPNGTYYLIARVDNKYGSYESGKVKISINNVVVANQVRTDSSIQTTSQTATQSATMATNNENDPLAQQINKEQGNHDK